MSKIQNPETPEERKARLDARRTRQRTPIKVISVDRATARAQRSATYKPNGKRECARRVRQMAKRAET